LLNQLHHAILERRGKTASRDILNQLADWCVLKKTDD
jgi:hypothetical protein